MARCGDCKFWQDFKKVDEYIKGPCCLIQTINYYQDDKSANPRKAYLPVTENDGRNCKSFERKIPTSFNEQADPPF